MVGPAFYHYVFFFRWVKDRRKKDTSKLVRLLIKERDIKSGEIIDQRKMLQIWWSYWLPVLWFIIQIKHLRQNKKEFEWNVLIKIGR